MCVKHVISSFDSFFFFFFENEFLSFWTSAFVEVACWLKYMCWLQLLMMDCDDVLPSVCVL